jgi:inorganic triphosphatase YgiF
LKAIAIRFAGSLECLEKAKQWLESVAQSPSQSSVLSAVYYDSPNFKLRRRGFALCIREQDGRWTQVLTSPPNEWKDAVTGERPDLAAPETGPRLRGPVLLEELQPIFKATLCRTVLTVEPQSSTRIEAAIDEGDISSIDRKAAVSEVELKLESGDPGPMYDTAVRLLDLVPLRIEVRSIATRGYALIDRDRRSAQTRSAEDMTVHASMTVEGVLQDIGRHCISHALGHEAAAVEGEPEGVHQMRVAARRLRAAVSALKIIIPASDYQWVSGELQWLAGELGPARNWDVFTASLLRPVEQALPVEVSLGCLLEAAEQRRRAAYERAKEAIASRRYTLTILQLTRWFEVRGWRDQSVSEQAALLSAAIGDLAPRLIEHRWRRARKRSRHFDRLSPDERHKLRIALKKLRYTIDFFEDLFDGDDVQALMRRLKPLQEDLGHVNDVRTAHFLVEEVSQHVNKCANEISRAGGIMLGWHDRGLMDREAKLRKDIRRLRRAKPFWPRTNPILATTGGEPPTTDSAGQATELPEGLVEAKDSQAS